MDDKITLTRDEDGLVLTDGALALRGDLSDMAPRLSPARLGRELLVRAARIKGADRPLTAIDATAGLGNDGLLLAAAGFEVTLYESDPTIAALLKDALVKALDDPALSDAASRMRAVEGDSVAALRALADKIAGGCADSPDLVYLDPMFPERRKSAAVKKKFQLLHQLERPCDNPEDLLEAALSVHPRKVVVKRPIKGPYLADVKPSYSLRGKAIRYDCIVCAPSR